LRHIITILIVVLCAGCVCAAAGLNPIIKNSGFEDAGPGIPSWEWYGGSGASCGVSTDNPHSGARCLVFSNAAENPITESFGRFQQWFGLLPGMKYELAVWVRGEDVRPGSYFTDWCNFRMDIPAGTYGWKRVSKVFFAQRYLNWVNFGMNVGGPAKSFAIDDIELRPVPTPFKGKGVEGSYTTPGRVDGDDKANPISIAVTSSLGSTAALEVSITASGKPVFAKTAEIKPGANSFDWQWNTGKLMTRDLVFSLRVTDASGKVIARASQGVEKVSFAILLAEIDGVEKRLNGEFASLYNKCGAKGIPTDYPSATRTMLRQFIPLERQDAKGGDQRRADLAVRDFKRALDESIAEMRACLANPKLGRGAVRYQTGRLKIDGLSLIGDRVDAKGRKSRGPVFLCGYGHFAQARKDLPLFPGYGVNIIQSAEFGPSAVLTSENEVSYDAIETLIRTLDDAAANNARVDVLMSPHYFPAWLAQKWPRLGTGGFVGYPVDLPEAKFMIEKYLSILIPTIKDKPALHSICLANEPAFDNTTGAANTKPMWVDYLIERYGDIKNLDATYSANYASFDDVPMGGGDAGYYDWCIFNRQRFAAWHRWMADVIHEMAPDLPVHSKVCTIVTLPSRVYSGNGVDLELMGRVSDFNGNDCCFYTGDEDGFASYWQLQNVAYDMQRSFNRKPIFNSENHISRDFSMNYIPPQHFRTVLWQGAVHGQACTTIWIWERAGSAAGTWCFYGNAMDRPGCALAVGTTCMDLNRFSAEVTALQNARAPVAILYSNASFIKNASYNGVMNRAYEALNFCGVKVDFISESQLASMFGRDFKSRPNIEAANGLHYRMIVLPEATNILAATLHALRKLPASTRLVIVGDGPAKDPYGKPLPTSDAAAVRGRALCLADGDSGKVLWPAMRGELGRLGALPEVSVVDASTGKPVWGVEWLSAKVGGRTVVNMVDLRDCPMQVRIVRNGRSVKARNLLSLGGLQHVGALKPEVPILAEVGN